MKVLRLSRTTLASLAVLVLSTPSYSETKVVYGDQSTGQGSLPYVTGLDDLNFTFGDSIDDFPIDFDAYVNDSSGNIPLGFKKGDWKKPIKWKSRDARKANYGDGVTIGIMDTPINCNHRNLKTTSKRICETYGWWNDGSFENNDRDHGSNAAGVAAGTGGYGLASKANIVGVAVFDDDGWYVSNAQFRAAVDFLVNTKGAKVINWSFGVPYTPGNTFYPITFDIAAARIAKNKALIVKSAGNGYQGKGQHYDSVRLSTTRKNVLKSYLNNVIFVGALDKKGRKIAKWSDRPGEGCVVGTQENRCTQKNKYKYYFIVAPGYVRTTSGNGNGSTKTAGTSFSAPIVAGAAALIQSRWSHLKPHQVRDILLKTATDMGKKGVDKVYGRGALNITRAMKPVKGKIGGVKIKSSNPAVFNRVGSIGGFSNEIKVIDAFGRDFDAVAYSFGNQAIIKTVDILPDSDFSIHLNQSAMTQDDMSFVVSGVSIGGLSYFAEISKNNEYTSFESDDGPLSGLPSSLLALNTGNQAIIYEEADFAIFALAPNSESSSVLDTSTIGFTKTWVASDNLTFTSTAAFMTEKGFHGLSSAEAFGFENKNNSAFMQVGLSHVGQFGSLDLGVNHHVTNASYSSENISWEGLGVSQLQAGFSTTFGDTSVGLKATSALNTTGNLKSIVKGLTSPGDFYHQEAMVALNFKKNYTELSSVDFNLSTEQGGAVDISYKINF